MRPVRSPVLFDCAIQENMVEMNAFRSSFGPRSVNTNLPVWVAPIPKSVCQQTLQLHSLSYSSASRCVSATSASEKTPITCVASCLRFSLVALASHSRSGEYTRGSSTWRLLGSRVTSPSNVLALKRKRTRSVTCRWQERRHFARRLNSASR